jgi:hypothetical protein
MKSLKIILMGITERSSFVDESLRGRAQDFTTSASALLSPTLPVKQIFKVSDKLSFQQNII